MEDEFDGEGVWRKGGAKYVGDLRMVRCMVKVFIHGKTDENTMVSTSMTKNMDMVYTNGPT